MRRYYILPRRIWEEPIDFGGMMLPRYNLFHAGVGSAWLELPAGQDTDTWLLLSTDFSVEWAEEQWHAHPDVAHLAHPTRESDIKLVDLHRDPRHAHKRFKEHHWRKLAARFALNETHSVWDLHDRARAIDPDCRLSNTY